MSRWLIRVRTWYEAHLRRSRMPSNDEFYTGDPYHPPKWLLQVVKQLEHQRLSFWAEQLYNYKRM